MNWLTGLVVSNGKRMVSYVNRSCVFLLAMVAGLASAEDSKRQSALESLYEYSGVQTQLNWIQSNVLAEARPAWHDCGDDATYIETKSMLAKILAVDELKREFLNELDRRINDEQLDKITHWTQSDVGKSLFKAERETVDFDEQKFNSLIERYTQSKTHSDTRNKRIQKLIKDTGAAYFVSALNTEISAIVAIASVCSNSEEALSAAQNQIKEERRSEAFYRSFMSQELVVPAAVVYRNMSDEHLDAISAFAKTDAGDAYYTALVKGTRSVLASKVDHLTDMLQTMPAKSVSHSD